MKKIRVIAIVALALASVALGASAYRYYFVVAPTPGLFAEPETLDQATQRAAEDGRVILVVVTADFCPTCQAYKRHGLADPAVAEWADQHAETVYLEWERDADAIASLGVRGFPTTLVLGADGAVLRAQAGDMTGSELLGFARRAAAEAAAS